MIISTSVTHAKICWALKVVLSKYSKSSCDDIGQLFKVMFPNSKVGIESCFYQSIQKVLVVT